MFWDKLVSSSAGLRADVFLTRTWPVGAQVLYLDKMQAQSWSWRKERQLLLWLLITYHYFHTYPLAKNPFLSVAKYSAPFHSSLTHIFKKERSGNSMPPKAVVPLLKWEILFPSDHFVMFGDICGCHNSGSREVVFGIHWVEAMGAAKHLKMHSVPSSSKTKLSALQCQ